MCLRVKKSVVLKQENGSMLMRLQLSTSKKSALSKHAMVFDHKIVSDYVEILKSESHAYRIALRNFFLQIKRLVYCM